MLSRLAANSLVAALALLTACAQQPKRNYAVSYSPEFQETEFLYAADVRDLRVSLHGVDDQGFALAVPAGPDGPLPRVASRRSIAFVTELRPVPDNSVVLPYTVYVIANPVALADDRAICAGRLPATRGPVSGETRLHAVLCRAAKPLAAVIGDADADIFRRNGFEALVYEMTAVMANPRHPERLRQALAQGANLPDWIVPQFPEEPR